MRRKHVHQSDISVETADIEQNSSAIWWCLSISIGKQHFERVCALCFRRILSTNID
jgi:hypothetical protein